VTVNTPRTRRLKVCSAYNCQFLRLPGLLFRCFLAVSIVCIRFAAHSSRLAAEDAGGYGEDLLVANPNHRGWDADGGSEDTEADNE
jgi:hypothetical protein